MEFKLNDMCEWERKKALFLMGIAEDLGISLFTYDLGYMEVIENLLAKTYGEIPSSVILWYVFEKTSEHGEECSIIDENEVEHIIKTPKQLYKFIKQYE